MRSVLAVVLAICLAGCTTMRPMAVPISAQSVGAGVKVGQLVRILTRSDRVLDLKVTALEPEALFGRAEQGDGKLYKVPYGAIQSLEAREFSGPKTTGAIGAGVMLTYGLVLAAAHAVGKAFEREFANR